MSGSGRGDGVEALEAMLDVPARVEGARSVPVSYAEAEAEAAAGTGAEQAEAITAMAHAATLPLAESAGTGTAHCQRCEVVPRPLAGPGTLHVNLPHTHTLGKVLAWVVRSGLPHARDGGTLLIEVGGGGPRAVLGQLSALLAGTEARDARALFQHGGEAPSPGMYFRAESLAAMLDRLESAWLLELLRGDRVTSHFQPIVGAGGAELHAYECLMRGERDGRVVMPGPILDAARKSDLVFQVDQAGRKAAVYAAVARGITAHKVFINFTPNAIYDPAFCLDSTVRMIDDGGLDRKRVVFEVTESERLPDLDHLVRIVGYYRDKGLGVALDDVGAGYASLQVLLGLKPDYVKLDMSLVRNVDTTPHHAVLLRKLVEACRELGLLTVAEGVETRAEWDWLRAHGVDFVQGYYFARPAATPPTGPWAGPVDPAGASL